MGRPINKRFFGDTAGGGNQIIIRGDIGAGVFTGFIVRQKSTREFIANINGTEGRVRLVGNNTPGVGEAFIEVFEDGSDADGSGADFTADMELTTMAVATDVGGGHSVADTLTITGGTGTSATLNVDSVIPLNGETDADYDGAGTPANGTFVAGATYSLNDVITMNDGTTVTVNGPAGPAAITAFTVTTATTTVGQTTDGVTLTQSSVTPANGSGFTLTMGDPNQALHTLSNPAASVSILAAGDYTALATSPAAQTSDGVGTGATITLTDYAVVSWTAGTTEVDDGTLYDQAPLVTVSGGGGTGATATASLDGTTGNIDNVNITGQGSGFTTIPTIAFTNAGRKFVERIKQNKVNATDGVQTQWDNTLGVTPPAGQSRIVAS